MNGAGFSGLWLDGMRDGRDGMHGGWVQVCICNAAGRCVGWLEDHKSVLRVGDLESDGWMDGWIDGGWHGMAQLCDGRGVEDRGYVS